ATRIEAGRPPAVTPTFGSEPWDRRAGSGRRSGPVRNRVVGRAIARRPEVEARGVDRKTKQELATSLNTVFKQAGCLVVARNGGLTVAEMSDLRRQVRAAGARFRITKNRITKLALDGTSYVPIRDLLKGPTGIAYSDDPVAAAKVVVGFASRNDKLAIV